MTSTGNEEAADASPRKLPLAPRGKALSAGVCVSHKRPPPPCLRFVRGVFCLDVISDSLFLIRAHAGEDAAYFRGAHSDTTPLSAAAAPALGFLGELAQTPRKTKTEILAPGLKYEKGGRNKREFELNEHALVA